MILTNRFDRALLMASKIHAEQTRKGTKIPYLSHCLGVAAIALEHGATEDQAIAALLHDAIEDGDGAATRKEILEAFGADVEGMVVGCSDSDGPQKDSWVDRKCDYLAHLPQAKAGVLLVSAADKLHNLRSILTDLGDPAVGKAVFERFKGGPEGTVWYYASLVAAFRKSDKVNESLLKDLECALQKLESIAGRAAVLHPAVPNLPERAKTPDPQPA